MDSAKARISKRTVDAFPTPAAGEARLWDTEVKGFFLRVYASGRRVYAVKYRLGRVQRIHTIGVHGSPWTPEAARTAAKNVLEAARNGDDPAAEKRALRDAVTVGELIDRYLQDGPATKPSKRASTWENDASNLNRHVRPLVGRKLADSVTKADAARLVQEVRDGRTAVEVKTKPRGVARVTGGDGVARRTRMTAAAMYAWGVEHGLVKQNPFAGVKLSAAPVRERFLSRAEAGRLLDALNALEAGGGVSSTFADAVRLLMLTGARKTEILGLRWSEVDFERRQLVLPPERTKAGGKTGERRIVLSPPALALLAKRTRDGAFVFPAASGEGHAIGLRRAFVRACTAAGLDGVRVHDLRHSFASFAVADGASLFLVAKLLGHASARTAERYSHLSGDALQEAAAAIAERIVPTGAPPSDERKVVALKSDV